jgi:amino acid adenylation domain-containing protein
LEVEGQILTYADLQRNATTIAAALSKHSVRSAPPLTAVFAYRSVTAFSGVLAALFRGHGYVPLNRTFPPERTRLMLERSGCEAIIVDAESEAQLEAILQESVANHLVLLPHRESVQSLADKWPGHRFLGANALQAESFHAKERVAADAIAYLLFTSGSTGQPKGVMVSNGNVLHYVNYVSKRYGISELDRLSQTFDMTFDLSAHDMFVAWSNGACLCCPSQKALIKPGRFINDSHISVWFSVPSTAVFMKRFGELKPGLYPTLRLSLFCGEALPAQVAQAWVEAAPRSVVENIYGPTELTIACTAYRWNQESSPGECELGTVPIGSPFDGMEALVADEELKEVAPGAEGELLMTGPQLSLGYWQDEAKTAKAFVIPPGKDKVYYRTGDRVRRPYPGAPMTYLGRMDHQLKVLGHRVELGEVEAVVREESKIDAVVALGWPPNAGGADGVEVFIQANGVDTRALLERIKARLPAYMTPRRIHLLPSFPLNSNGKFDRKAMIELLDCKPKQL